MIRIKYNICVTRKQDDQSYDEEQLRKNRMKMKSGQITHRLGNFKNKVKQRKKDLDQINLQGHKRVLSCKGVCSFAG